MNTYVVNDLVRLHREYGGKWISNHAKPRNPDSQPIIAEPAFATLLEGEDHLVKNVRPSAKADILYAAKNPFIAGRQLSIHNGSTNVTLLDGDRAEYFKVRYTYQPGFAIRGFVEVKFSCLAVEFEGFLKEASDGIVMTLSSNIKHRVGNQYPWIIPMIYLGEKQLKFGFRMIIEYITSIPIIPTFDVDLWCDWNYKPTVQNRVFLNTSFSANAVEDIIVRHSAEEIPPFNHVVVGGINEPTVPCSKKPPLVKRTVWKIPHSSFSLALERTKKK